MLCAQFNSIEREEKKLSEENQRSQPGKCSHVSSESALNSARKIDSSSHMGDVFLLALADDDDHQGKSDPF